MYLYHEYSHYAVLSSMLLSLLPCSQRPTICCLPCFSGCTLGSGWKMDFTLICLIHNNYNSLLIFRDLIIQILLEDLTVSFKTSSPWVCLKTSLSVMLPNRYGCCFMPPLMLLLHSSLLKLWFLRFQPCREDSIFSRFTSNSVTLLSFRSVQNLALICF